MTKSSINLNRTQKILLVLFELSQGKKKDIRYEDIVVALFKKYPEEFHLKGYPEYPDSGDGPQRTLYEGKKNGHITSGNKFFRLTDKGIDYVKEIKNLVKGKRVSQTSRLSAYSEKEMKRIMSSKGFNLFLKEEYDQVFDTDLYNYLGVTVRTDRSDFRGRIKALKDMVDELGDKKKDNCSQLIAYHNFLFDKFKKDIAFKLSNKA